MVNVTKNKWSGKTDGLPWMQKTLVVLFSWVNIRILYFFMGFMIPFYMLFNHQGYISIYSYFRKRYKQSALRAFINVYKNHFVFGQIILDRFAVYAGVRFDINIIGNEHFVKLVNRPEGFLILSSHIGNYELAGYHFASKTKPINALVYFGETETVMENRKKMFADKNVKMIPVRSDMSHIFHINDALLNGEAVSMPSDRVFGSPKYVECSFLGEKAKFPIGPFAVCLQRALPAIAIFVMKEKNTKYTIYVEKIDLPTKYATIRQGVSDMAQEYVSKMEDVLQKYPTQWFNYYNFWE